MVGGSISVDFSWGAGLTAKEELLREGERVAGDWGHISLGAAADPTGFWIIKRLSLWAKVTKGLAGVDPHGTRRRLRAVVLKLCPHGTLRFYELDSCRPPAQWK